MRPIRFQQLIWVLAGLSFVTPLIVPSQSFIFPFIVPKILWFRSLTLLMLGLYLLVLFIDWDRFRLRATPINVAVAFFLFSFWLSTIVGVDWYRSFWDNHERMLGLFTILHFGLYFYMLSQTVEKWKTWRTLLYLFLASGMIVMLIGGWQFFIDREALLNRGSDRVSATLGNAIYFSGYGLFLLYIGLLLFFRDKKSSWRYVALVGALMGFVGIFLGGTRGTIVGLGAAVGVALLLLLWKLPKGTAKKRLTIGLIAFAILLSGLWLARDVAVVRQLPGVGRVLATTVSSATASTRIMAWGIAVDAWKEAPLLGWGPNNYYYAFNEYYRPEFLERGLQETWFDNAHNAFMNTLAVQGLVGVFSYTLLFLAPMGLLFVRMRRDEIDSVFGGLTIAFLAGHFVHNFFVFENPTSYLYFFFLLAMIASTLRADPSGAPKEDMSSVSQKSFLAPAAIVLVAVCSLIYTTNLLPAKANQGTLDVIRSVNEGKVSLALEQYQEIASLPSPHIDDIRNDLGRTSAGVLQQLIAAGRGNEARPLFDVVYQEVQKNIELHPMDIRVHLMLSQIAQIGVNLTGDVSYIAASERFLLDALSYSPKRQQIQYGLARLYSQIDRTDDAIVVLEESIQNDPLVTEGWWLLAQIYVLREEPARAEQTIQDAQAAGIEHFGRGQPVIDEILAAIENGTTNELLQP